MKFGDFFKFLFERPSTQNEKWFEEWLSNLEKTLDSMNEEEKK